MHICLLYMHVVFTNQYYEFVAMEDERQRNICDFIVSCIGKKISNKVISKEKVVSRYAVVGELLRYFTILSFSKEFRQKHNIFLAMQQFIGELSQTKVLYNNGKQSKFETMFIEQYKEKIIGLIQEVIVMPWRTRRCGNSVQRAIKK